jgi:acyl transferase domain-containing protein
MGSTSHERASEPIAIIGLSCKFAGDATNPDELWKMLVEGKSAWSEVPASRFNLKGVYHPNHEKPSTVSSN